LRQFVACLLFAAVAHADASVPAARDAAALAVADRAAAEIEKMTQYHGASVGYGGAPGDTWLALQRILKLGANGAVPRLLKLAHSPSVVARMAAATGFGLLPSREGVLELRRMLNDEGTADAWTSGCVGGPTRVSAFAGAFYGYPIEMLMPMDVVVAEVVARDAQRAELRVLKVLAGQGVRFVKPRSVDDFPVGEKLIVFSLGGVEARYPRIWSEEDEAWAVGAISTSTRPRRPGP
jgi:hypothetical protein